MAQPQVYGRDWLIEDAPLFSTGKKRSIISAELTPVQLGIASAVHLAHATGSKRSKDLIRAKFVTLSQWHIGNSSVYLISVPKRPTSTRIWYGPSLSPD
jgi:hypothetical protein